MEALMVELEEGRYREGHMGVLGFVETEGVVYWGWAGGNLDFDGLIGLLVALEDDDLNLARLDELGRGFVVREDCGFSEGQETEEEVEFVVGFQ